MSLDDDRLEVALLTGGGDRPYAVGLAASLLSAGCTVDFIGSDLLEAPEFASEPRLRFLNLRGSQRPDATPFAKLGRVVAYYGRLLRYAATAKPRIFHILWNNKFEFFDRTALMAYYRLTRRKIVLTVHNVNAAARDGNDGFLNRLTLRVQYALAHHLFVHTGRMRNALESDFRVASQKISVIPFGLNDSVPNTGLTRADARKRLGLGASDRVVLFFGNIAPYKGVEYLVEATARVAARMPECRLVIAGRAAGAEAYWASIEKLIDGLGLRQHVVSRVEFVPDAETEWYFKAADILALPYTFVFQSGVMFLAYNFGLPVIAADVGSLRDDVIDGVTGYVCEPRNALDLAEKLTAYFESGLYCQLETHRHVIRKLAADRHAWSTVGSETCAVYRRLCTPPAPAKDPSGQHVRDPRAAE